VASPAQTEFGRGIHVEILLCLFLN
jgi:hypothetical protein